MIQENAKRFQRLKQPIGNHLAIGQFYVVRKQVGPICLSFLCTVYKNSCNLWNNLVFEKENVIQIEYL